MQEKRTFLRQALQVSDAVLQSQNFFIKVHVNNVFALVFFNKIILNTLNSASTLYKKIDLILGV